MALNQECELCLGAIIVPENLELWYLYKLIPFANKICEKKLTKKQIEIVMLFKTSFNFRFFLKELIKQGIIINNLLIQELERFEKSRLATTEFVIKSFLAEKNHGQLMTDQLNCTRCKNIFCKYHSNFMCHYKCNFCSKFCSLCYYCNNENSNCSKNKICEVCDSINNFNMPFSDAVIVDTLPFNAINPYQFTTSFELTHHGIDKVKEFISSTCNKFFLKQNDHENSKKNSEETYENICIDNEGFYYNKNYNENDDECFHYNENEDDCFYYNENEDDDNDKEINDIERETIIKEISDALSVN
uniref:Uncharacterized protein n=1 Tax=viral metagenome TaxID=1070528 RepID=A0A6C0ACX8_9ZZZZ